MHFQVEVKPDGTWWVRNVKTRAVMGRFKSREAAQRRADELERSFWGA
jgi:hypothetical protein